jgi:hypothetical protein
LRKQFASFYPCLYEFPAGKEASHWVHEDIVEIRAELWAE